MLFGPHDCDPVTDDDIKEVSHDLFYKAKWNSEPREKYSAQQGTDFYTKLCN